MTRIIGALIALSLGIALSIPIINYLLNTSYILGLLGIGVVTVVGFGGIAVCVSAAEQYHE